VIALAPPPAAGTAEDLLSFVSPLPGLGDARSFTLSVLDDAGVLYAMRSTTEPAVRLFLVRPEAFFADYRPELPDDLLGELGAARPQDVAVLVVVTPGGDGEAPTANLPAPVVAHLGTGRAAQVVLDGTPWPLRAPLATS